MGWRAGCPQGPSLCPEAPHLAAGTASVWGLGTVEGTIYMQFKNGGRWGLQLPSVGQGFPTSAVIGGRSLLALSCWGSSCGMCRLRPAWGPCSRRKARGRDLFSMQAGVPAAEEGR